MSKATEGPWSYDAEQVHGERRGYIFSQVLDKEIEDKRIPVGRVCERGIGMAASKANAILIAAAPDLLAACEAVVQWYENAGNEDPDQQSAGSVDLWAKCRNAAQKARGKHERTQDGL